MYMRRMKRSANLVNCLCVNIISTVEPIELTMNEEQWFNVYVYDYKH